VPKLSDSDQPGEIVFTSNHDCPDCGTTSDVSFPTGAQDEDGLADLVPGDLETEHTCSECGVTSTATYSGWMNYGDA
jgi:hypothetical protein